MLCACGRGEPGLAELGEALRECPNGDAAWRPLLDHPDSAEAPEGLRETLARLGEACPDRWEPEWAMAESLIRADLTSEAAPHLERSLRLADGSSDPTGIALSKNGLGWSAYVEGRYDEAEELYREALQAAHEAGRIDVASFVHNNLAHIKHGKRMGPANCNVRIVLLHFTFVPLRAQFKSEKVRPGSTWYTRKF